MAHEEWKTIGTSRYEVSSSGAVRNCTTGKVLSCQPDRSGYLRVRLGRGRWYRVHLLVAAAFLPPPNPGLEVNHIDGNKRNNVATNLEFVTHLENVRHAWRLGLYSHKGEQNTSSKLSDLIVKAIRCSAEPSSVLASRYQIHRRTVQKIRSRERWAHI